MRFLFSTLTTSSSDRNPFHPQRRLADADRHALAVLAAGADSRIERKIVPDHGDAVQVGRPVADQHRALQGCPDLAVLDLVGLGALEHILPEVMSTCPPPKFAA